MNADVVTNNFRTGVSARLGIDAKTLQRMKPELIVLESAAYGATGPKSDRGGFDMAFQAFCGHEHRAGGTGNPPLWNRTSMVDYTGGLMGAIALLRALYDRARMGNGAELSVALMNSGIFLLSELIQRSDGTSQGVPPLNHEQTGYHPAEQMYEAGDGWIAVSARDTGAARSLANELGLGELAKKPRADWNAADAADIANAMRPRATQELLRSMEKAGVWSELCRKGADAATLNDAALVEAGIVYLSRHLELGGTREIGPLFSLSRSLCSGTGHTPLKGEHTKEILGELGYAPEAIEQLLQRKAVA
jgi:crotonobetainyl-CoA:carnitine CoA-transferase CaiB-like acyl-CoA transferase